MPASIHCESMLIPTASAGADKRIRVSALLGLMQDAASNHASRLGVGYDHLVPLHRTFVLSRLELHVDQALPLWGETILLRTWPRKLDRLLAYRDFSLCAEGSDEPFLRATSSWLLIDTQLRRPARPHDALLSIQPHSEIAVCDQAPDRIPNETETTVVCTRRAYHSDLDPNGHVNNTRYFDWITDALAVFLHEALPIQSLSIHFLKEIQLGDTVEVAVKPLTGELYYLEGRSGHLQYFSARISIHRK